MSGRSSSRWGGSRRWGVSRHRRPCLEPLEKRLVLSLSPVDDEVAITAPLDDIVQFTSFGRSMAMDNDGDFVVVWAQADPANEEAGVEVYGMMIDREGTPLTPEPFPINTTVPGNQTTPVVAMDADGEFVVAWTGPSPEAGSLTDIYARRFNSVGDPIGNEFRVNDNINNRQDQPAIGMDSDGNFTIAWATSGQDFSFFNNIRAQRYDRDATPLGPEFGVNLDNANEHNEPEVSMSPDGDRILIAWTDSLPLGPGPVIESTVFAVLYDGAGNPLTDRFIVDSGQNASVDFDTGGNFLVAFDTFRNNDFGLDPPLLSIDQHARFYNRDGQQIFTDSIFVNEMDRNPVPRAEADLQLWPYGDFFGGAPYSGAGTGNPSVALDADFDFTVTYEGLGSDFVNGLYLPYPFPLLEDPLNPGDGYGILQSLWDAAPSGTVPQPTVVTTFGSDHYINTTLDGQSAVWEITISDDSIDGTFELYYVYGNALGPIGPIPIEFDSADPAATADAINDALEELAETGIHEDSNLVNSIIVEAIDPYTFDVYFIHSLHSTPIVLIPGESELTTDVEDVFGTFEVTMLQEGYIGSIQSRSAVAMEPDGDYVVTWTGYNMDDPSPAGYLLDTTIYYRRFDESTDTAGPKITDVYAPDGNRVDGGEVLPAAINSLKLTFDEQMRESTVLDPENYKIIRNGEEELIGTIADVVNYQLNPDTNKWEVTLLLDGNGFEDGVPPLDEGNYEIVGVNRIRDYFGNPLEFTGYATNGRSYRREFAIQVPAGGETRANSTTVGDQFTEEFSPQTIAADADGDFVVVWTANGQDGSGFGVYAQQFNANGTPRGPEFRVNTTTTGDQRYASVAMDADGDFIVTWSQFSSGTNWDIYAQRFNSSGGAVGREFRVNSTTNSIQRYSSVAMDVDGDFIVAWQSFNQDGSGYGIYSQRYNSSGSRLDGVDEVQILSFGGSPTGGTFTLIYNGQETQPVVYTPQSGGSLTAAELELALRQFVDVRVTALNSLQYQIQFTGVDGSLDTSSLVPGANNTGASMMSVATEIEGLTGESLVNDTTLNNQRFPSVDMDSVGNYIITWTSSGQDGDEPFEQNIYAKRFLNIDSGSSPPNPGPGVQFTLADAPTLRKWGAAGLGTGATITYAFMTTEVMDTQDFDGGWTNTPIAEFMPEGAEDEIRRAFEVWSSVANINFVETTDAGEDFGVLLPNSADIRIGGHPVEDEDETLAHGFFPPIAGQLAGGAAGDIHFDTDEEWQIGTTGEAIDIFLVALHEIGHAIGLGHVDLTSEIMFPDYSPFHTGLGAGDILGGQYLYGIRGNAIGGEFLVNQTTTNDQRWSSIGIDADGDFVIAWTSYGQDGGGNGYGPGFNGEDGIVARRYDRFGAPVADEFLVNDFRDQNQRYPRVAMDADGDFAIAWQSYQDRTPPSDAPDSYGVYARIYRPDAENAGPNGEFGFEFRANTTVANEQRHPGIASSNDGRLIVAWSGFGDQPTQLDSQGVFFQRYNSPGEDETPPTVGGVAAVGSLRIVVSFSEEMSTLGGASGVDSVLNEALWGLSNDNGPINDPFASISFGFNESFNVGLSTTQSNKWEAVLTLNSPLLLQTNYTLRLDDAAADVNGNKLDGDYNGEAGTDFSKVFQASNDSAVGAVGNQFLVNATQSAGQDDSAVATNVAGDFVVVWTSASTPGVNGDIRGQRYNNQGVAQGTEFTIHPSTTGNQDSADVAMDALGNFVVVWAGAGSQDVEGIYARRFDSLGQALDAQPIFVNLGSTNINEAQLTPSVTRAPNGSFIVSWVTKTGSGDQGDVMVRLYSAAGAPLTNELLVNTTTSGRQYAPDVAVNSNGDFVVTWTSDGQDGDQGGVYARRYNASGVAQGGEFRVNTTTAQSQVNPSITMADNGFFTIAWTSNLQDGNGQGVFLQRFNSAGAKLNPGGLDFQVNQFTSGAQSEPAITGDSNGNFIVTWSTANQDTSGLGVMARVFTSTGDDAFGGEFLVNTTFSGDQRRPAIAGNDDGDVVITWTSPDSSSTGIYAQRYRFAPPAAPPNAVPSIAGVRVLRSSNPDGVYTIPVGSGEQLRTVNVGLVNQIQIAFSEDVIVQQSDLVINGVVQATYAPSAFQYDPVLHVATWTLPTIFNDRITITLSEAVRDVTGNALDGEWENPTSLADPSSSTFSGNGLGGGNFTFKFTVLSSDYNRDNRVDGGDFTIWAGNFGVFGGDARLSDGDSNGDGAIDGGDFTVWAGQFGINYSSPPPSPPATGGFGIDGPALPTAVVPRALEPRDPTALGRVGRGASPAAVDALMAAAPQPASRQAYAARRTPLRAEAIDTALGDWEAGERHGPEA